MKLIHHLTLKKNLSNPFLTLAAISYTVTLIHQFTSHIKKMLTNPLLQWLQNNCLLHYTDSEFTSLYKKNPTNSLQQPKTYCMLDFTDEIH